jgi:hypothetical protein
MPATEAPAAKSKKKLRAPDQAVMESLTPFEGVMVQQMSALHEALLDEFQGLRQDIGRFILAAGGGTLLVVLFLIAGILLVRGEDPGAAADAVKEIAPLVTGAPGGTE